MFFRQLLARDATLSYLFGCGKEGKALAVDVLAGDEQWFYTEAKQEGVTITHVIDTHIHADHYSGGRTLAKQVGALYCLHAQNIDRVKYPFFPLDDNVKIEFGNVDVQILYTPGHTLDSVSLLVTDKRRGAEPWFLLTGDTLFVGAIGRPDLAGAEQEMAEMLYDSITTRILPLSDNLEIFPGHRSGSVCGVGISGKPSSTLGFEKRWNPYLTMDKDTFVTTLLDNIPPYPVDMTNVIATNLGW